MFEKIYRCNVPSCENTFSYESTTPYLEKPGWWNLTLMGDSVYVSDIDICPNHVLEIRTEKPSLLLEVLENARQAYRRRREAEQAEVERQRTEEERQKTERFHGITAR